MVIRVLARSVTDLAKRRGPQEQLFPPEVAVGLEELLAHVGGAMVSFAVLVTTQVSRNAEEAEERLTAELAAALATRENVAQVLLRKVQEHPEAWQLHGSMLAEIDRILDELDLEHRSRRLMEELDRASLVSRERFSGLARLRSVLRGGRRRGERERPAVGAGR